MVLDNLKIKCFPDRGITLENDTHVVSLSDFHIGFCCEQHYIDWHFNKDKVSEDITFTFDTDNYDSLIWEVEGYGLMLVPNKDTKVLCPGYGINNGRNPNNLYLTIIVIDKEAIKTVHIDTLDISNCQEIKKN